MKIKIGEILEKIFSIIILLSIISTGVIFLLFLISIIVGNDLGNAIALWIKNEFINHIIRLTAIAVLCGLVKMYILKEHELTIK
jgi:hypothetical protein